MAVPRGRSMWRSTANPLKLKAHHIGRTPRPQIRTNRFSSKSKGLPESPSRRAAAARFHAEDFLSDWIPVFFSISSVQAQGCDGRYEC